MRPSLPLHSGTYPSARPVQGAVLPPPDTHKLIYNELSMIRLHFAVGLRVVRVCAMFPIIPQHLSVSQVVTPRKRSRVAVVAACDIPLHTCTGPLLVYDIVHSKLGQLKVSNQLSICFSSILCFFLYHFNQDYYIFHGIK